LDEKGYVQAHLPHDVVTWITEDSRQEMKEITTTIKVDEVEKEVEGFKRRLTSDDLPIAEPTATEWHRGWKKWDGEWTPRPIGL
jgi:hypothetical protein